MRNKRKMETVRIRKANATIKKEKVVCFAQDRDVSTRILAILFYKGTNTSGISNVSTRGQPTTSIFCKKDIKGSIKSAISENPSFKQFLEENNAYGRYVKNVTNQILRSRDISVN